MLSTIILRLILVLSININSAFSKDDVTLSTMKKQKFKVTLKLCTSPKKSTNCIKVKIIENNKVLYNSKVLLRILSPLNIQKEYIQKWSDKEGNFIFHVKLYSLGKYKFLISFLTSEGVTRIFIGDFLFK